MLTLRPFEILPSAALTLDFGIKAWQEAAITNPPECQPASKKGSFASFLRATLRLAPTLIPAAAIITAYALYNIETFGSIEPSYSKEINSMGFNFSDLLFKYGSLVNDSRVYGTDTGYLTHIVPWYPLMIAGALIGVFTLSRPIRYLIAASLLSQASYLGFNDLVPTGLFIFNNIHYFTWSVAVIGVSSIATAINLTKKYRSYNKRLSTSFLIKCLDEAALTRKNLGWEYGEFEVPQESYDQWRQAIERGAAAEAAWNATLADYRAKYPTEAAQFERQLRGELPQGWDANLPSYSAEDKGLATRQHSYNCLNAIGPNLPELIGGSADLTHSNLTDIKGESGFQKGAEANRYLHFGVREHAMGAILNGLAYHGSGLVPYGGTFCVFAGYMLGAMRLSALSELGVIYVFTHDSIGLGEDGPTHQPIETLASLRSIPNMLVIRPGDGNETSGAYKVAVANRHRPTVMFLSRQAMANQANSNADYVAKGGYILEDSNGAPDLILIGTGTELDLCVKAAAQLRAEGKNVRVVSMPCVDLFEEQDAAYRESVLPAACRKRLVVEASSSFGWHKYTGFEGDTVSIDRFGASAPGPLLMEKFGFTVDNVVAKAKALG